MNNFRFLLISFFLCSSLFAQTRTTIAVMDLGAAGVAETDAQILTSRLRTDLFNTKKFMVLERDKMNEILAEQGFQQSGCTTNECIVEAGKLIGVQQMVAGEIGKIGNLYTITIRLINEETGAVLKTATEDCECKIEQVVTQSVKNVAEILAGNKIQSETYSTSQRQTTNYNETGLTEWEMKGMTREEYVDFVRSGIEIEKWVMTNKSKNPSKAYWLSFFFPGLGQYYNDDIGLGVVHNILYGLGMVALTTGHFEEDKGAKVFTQIALGVAAVWIWSQFDARSSAIDFNEELKKKYNLSLVPKLNKYSNQPMLGVNIAL